MKIINKTLKINTKEKTELINLTKQIKEETKETITNGLINIYTTHTTTSIIINEDEEGLKKDIKNILNKIIPKETYYHDKIDNNADSHLKSLILSQSQTIPIKNSQIQLGTWQSIFLLELDGPRNNRTIELTIIGK